MYLLYWDLLLDSENFTESLKGMAMKIDFIHQIIKSTLILAALGFLINAFYFGVWDGLALLFGACWGCANLWIIKNLIQNLFLSEKNYLKILAVLGLKFPVLYLTGFLLLNTGYLSPTNVLIGFSLIFLVILSQSLWNLIPKKTTIAIITIIFTSHLSAASSIESEVPELPNVISLLHHTFKDTSWIDFLVEWDSLIYSIGIALGLVVIFHLGTRKKNMIPTPFQNFLEWIVENLRKFILDILGPEGDSYVPFLGTLFLYILTMNWLVLIPLMKAPSSNFNITIALALCVFVLVQYLNVKNQGVKGFLYHLAGSPKGALGWALVPLMFPIEVLTQFTRPLTLGLRLFGNVLGEDILIGAFALFGVAMLAYFDAPIGFPLQIPFMFLALLTGLMQALVFTLLSTIYILLSRAEVEEHT